MNRQSNTYTIIYAIILVVVVGVVLSVVYQGLRPQQLENISNDTKRQILAAALITPKEGESVSDLYASHIRASYIVNSKGEKMTESVDPFDVNVSAEVKKPADERMLPVFECETTQGVKYIVPVYGAGLWGPIWGYIAMDSDGNSIYGAYFAHQGETPGLGPWRSFLERRKNATEEVVIGLVGKYDLQDAYKSIRESLSQAGTYNDHKTVLKFVNSEMLNEGNVKEKLAGLDGVVICPGFGQRGIEG